MLRSSSSSLQDRYFERLGFSQEEVASLSQKLSKENLDKIMEAHLAHITFDNLSQHGLPLEASLDVEKTAHKILDQKRGGFCFELNGLLGELLLELGYSVKRVPAIVHAGDEQGFRGNPTHLVLVVSADGEEQFFVDVGFGEPAIHSLRYELDVEQETPEGMVSRLVTSKEEPFEERTMVVLEWKIEEKWQPRILFDFDHPGQDLSLFQEGLDAVLGPSSIFSEKLIVTTLDRNQKTTLAGRSLKITSPRFGPNSESTVEHLESIEAVHKVLGERFDLSMEKAMELDLTRSDQAKPEVWT